MKILAAEGCTNSMNTSSSWRCEINMTYIHAHLCYSATDDPTMARSGEHTASITKVTIVTICTEVDFDAELALTLGTGA